VETITKADLIEDVSQVVEMPARKIAYIKPDKEFYRALI
jgi:hypothetical protein